METIINPPALVRAHDDLAELATKINAAHEAGEKAVRKGLEHYRAAGEMLLRAKASCQRGKWLSWLKQHVKFSTVTVSKYMRLAAGWDRLTRADNLMDALDQLGSQRSKLEPSSDFHQTQEESEQTEADQTDTVTDCPPQEADQPKPHVARNTGEHEWYTPPVYLDAARIVLGDIELDPASSDIAQRNVQAKVYYTKENDGLSKTWTGKVWMNPPYQAGLIDQFTEKLCGHYDNGDVPEAIVLVNNATETEWFQELASRASSICFPAKRVRFLDPEGNPGAPLQGQAVLYLGDHVEQFAESFVQFGLILRR